MNFNKVRSRLRKTENRITDLVWGRASYELIFHITDQVESQITDQVCFQITDHVLSATDDQTWSRI